MYFNLLYCTLLYCTLLYTTLLYSTVLYCTLLYRTLPDSNLLYWTPLYGTLLYSAILSCISQPSVSQATLCKGEKHLNIDSMMTGPWLQCFYIHSSHFVPFYPHSSSPFLSVSNPFCIHHPTSSPFPIASLPSLLFLSPSSSSLVLVIDDITPVIYITWVQIK